MHCPATADLNRFEAEVDKAARRELSVESRAAEIAQEMLELERVISDTPMTVNVYDIDDDLCTKIYEDCGSELVKLIRLMLQANYLESPRMKSDSEVQLQEQLTQVKLLAHERLVKLCEKVAEREIDFRSEK